MYIRNSSKYGKNIKTIHPGEYYISTEDEIIGTLLGSCVALCLFDVKRGIAGMNHFMLPGKIRNDNIHDDRSAKYGITAINKLLSEMIKKGAVKNDIIAKVFGGGKVLEHIIETNTIPADNIRVAKIMMEMENIQIAQIDVGGNFTRKILMEVKSGSVFLKKSTRGDITREVEKMEMDYARELAGRL